MEISDRKYDATLEVSRQDVVKVVLASFIGTFIRFYDYLIFGAAAALVFLKLFFSSLPPVVATIVSFSTIGVTFVTRPHLESQVGSIVGGFTPTIAAALLAWAGGSTWPIAVFLQKE